MGSSLCGAIMNRFVVLAACVCASTAQQVVVGGIAGAYNPAPSTQFHAQDEFGQFSFGHAGGPLARTEARNAYGVTTGSYQYVDANGLLQTVNHVADPVNGFRVAGTNLPVGPAVPALPYPYAAGLNLAYAGLPLAAPAVLPAAAAVAHAPIVKSVVETPAAVETEVAATPVISYAAAPAIAAPALSYAAAPAIAAPVATPLAAAAPVAVAAAAPSRDAVLTQIKLTPGHAPFYRVD